MNIGENKTAEKVEKEMDKRNIRVGKINVYGVDMYSIYYRTIDDIKFNAKQNEDIMALFCGENINSTSVKKVIMENIDVNNYIHLAWSKTLIVTASHFKKLFGNNVDEIIVDIDNHFTDTSQLLATTKNSSSDVFVFIKRCKKCGNIIIVPILCSDLADKLCICGGCNSISKFNEITHERTINKKEPLLSKTHHERESEISIYGESIVNMFELYNIESPIEKKLLSNLIKVDTIKVVPQYNVDKLYRIDFMIQDMSGNNLFGVECDGYEWHSSKSQMLNDYKRERNLKLKGIELIKFLGSEINNNCDECVDYIKLYASNKIEKRGIK